MTSHPIRRLSRAPVLASLLILALAPIAALQAQAPSEEAMGWLSVAADNLNDENPTAALESLDRFLALNRSEIPRSYLLRATALKTLNRNVDALAVVQAYKRSRVVSASSPSHYQLIEMETALTALAASERAAAAAATRDASRSAFGAEFDRVRTVADAQAFAAKFAGTAVAADARKVEPLIVQLGQIAAEQATNAQQLQRYQRDLSTAQSMQPARPSSGVAATLAIITTAGFIVTTAGAAESDGSLIGAGAATMGLGIGGIYLYIKSNRAKYRRYATALDAANTGLAQQRSVQSVLEARATSTRNELLRLKNQMAATLYP